MDVLKEEWEASPKSDMSVISHVMLMKERLERIATTVWDNLNRAQVQQKLWYDRTARDRSLEPGEQVLVLLPTSSSKLLAQWHGPYQVVHWVGKMNYLVDMADRRKRKRVFHINMLRKWNKPTKFQLFHGGGRD